MATNSPGNGKEILSAGVTSDVAAYVTARADRLEQTKAWALVRIIDFWIASGAPPLSQLDEKLPALSFEDFARGFSSEKKAAHDAARAARKRTPPDTK